MAVKADTFKDNEQEIRQLCERACKSRFQDKDAINTLRRFGFNDLNIIALAQGIIEVE